MISLGAVESELVDSITEPDVKKGIQELHEQAAIPTESFARAVEFAMSQPEEVDPTAAHAHQA